MAKRRVQVEKLRTPTASGPVARPVDTYVRPENAPLQKGKAQQLLEALAPAAETFGKALYKKEVAAKREEERLQLEAERKAEAEMERARRKAEAVQQAELRQEQAFQGRLGFQKFQSAWQQEYESDPEKYLNMDQEEVLQARQGLLAEALDGVIDPIVIESIEQDFAINQIQFQTDFAKGQKQYRGQQAMQNVFDVLGSSDLTGADFNTEADSQYALLRDIYGLNGRALNDSFMDMALANVQKGDRRMYTYLKSKGQHKVGDPARQKVVAQIESAIARQDAATAENNWRAAQANAKKAAEDNIVSVVLDQGRGTLGMVDTVSYEVVNKDGSVSTKTISPTQQRELVSTTLRRRNAEELRNTPPELQGQVIQDQAREWYTLGLENDLWKEQLEKGVNALSLEFTDNPDEVIQQAQDGFALFNLLYEENEKMTTEMMGKDNADLFRAIKRTMEHKDFNFEDAFDRVRILAVDPDAAAGRVDAEALKEALANVDDASDWNPFSDDSVLNMEYVNNYIKEEAVMDQIVGINSDVAVSNALETFKKNHTLVGRHWVDTSAFRFDPRLSGETLEEAFELILNKYEDQGGHSFKKMAGQSGTYRVIDEFGLPVMDIDEIRQRDLQKALDNVLLHEAIQIEADANGA